MCSNMMSLFEADACVSAAGSHRGCPCTQRRGSQRSASLWIHAICRSAGRPWPLSAADTNHPRCVCPQFSLPSLCGVFVRCRDHGLAPSAAQPDGPVLSLLLLTPSIPGAQALLPFQKAFSSIQRVSGHGEVCSTLKTHHELRLYKLYCMQ